MTLPQPRAQDVSRVLWWTGHLCTASSNDVFTNYACPAVGATSVGSFRSLCAFRSISSRDCHTENQKPPSSPIGPFTFPHSWSALCFCVPSFTEPEELWWFRILLPTNPQSLRGSLFFKGFFVKDSGLEIAFFQPVKFVISFSACLGHFGWKFSFEHCPLLGNACFPLAILQTSPFVSLFQQDYHTKCANGLCLCVFF